MSEELNEQILTPEVPEETVTPQRKPRKSKKKLWIGLGAGVVGVGAIAIVSMITIIVVALVLIFAFNTPRSVAKDYIKGISKADASYIFDSIHNSVKEENFASEREEQKTIEQWNESIDSVYDTLNNRYDEWEISYDIVDIYKVNDGYLEDIQEEYSEDYDCKVMAAKEIEICATLTADDRESSYDFTIMVVRIGTKWYLDTSNSDTPYSILAALVFSLYK